MANLFSKKFIAQKTFTDRDGFKKILRLSVETEQKFDEYRIKVFYGVGGQGKSYLKNIFLINEYLKPAAEKNPSLIYCDTIDFEKDEAKKQPDEALLSIAKVLIEKGDIALPAFTLGFLKYKNLSSASLNISQTYPYLFRLSGKKIVGSSLANEIFSEVVDFGTESLTSGIPIIGSFIKKMVGKGKDKIVEWIRKSDANEILADLDELDKFSLLERLPKLLAYDVFKTLENDYNKKNKQERRIVIILDGYETLWQNEKNENINKDIWVRTLAKYMPGVLFIIFGRDKLRWNEIDKDEEFSAAIEQHLIKGLSDNDADFYLKSVPIENSEIRKAIIQNSKGKNSEDGCLPLYLDIEVNTYEQIINKNQEPSVKDFVQGDEKTELEIVNRFFKHIRPELSNAIEALSLANYFDNEIIHLMENLAFAPGGISINTLVDFSFINLENDRATIHALVREVASEQYRKKQPQKYFQIQEALFNYFNNQLPSVEEEITPQIETILANAGHHKEIYDPKNFPNWILEKSYYLYGVGYYNTLDTQLKYAIELLNNNKQSEFTKENEFLLGKLYYQLAYNDDYAGRSLNADKNIRTSLMFFKSIFSDDFFKQFPEIGAEQKVAPETRSLITDFNLALELAARINASLGKNNECGKLYDEANKIAVQFKLNFDQYGFAVYLMRVGRLAEAEPYFFSQCNWKGRNYDLLYTALSAHDFAKLLRTQERFDEAIFYHKMAIDIYSRLKSKNHAYTGVALQSFAATLIEQGKDLTQAEELLNEVWDIYMKNYRDDHINFGMLYQDMFLLALKTNVNKALHYYDKAKEIISHNAGEMNSNYITMLINISEQLTANPINVNDEFTPMIINLFLNDFERVKELLGIYNNALHRGITITADYLEKEGDKKLANIFRKKKEEFIRILQMRTHIRTGSLNINLIVSNEKEDILSEFKQITSLPDDTSSIKLEQIILPFYNTYNLYRLTFLNSEKVFHKYVLYDGKTPIAIDWMANTIYMVNETDINLTYESVAAYTIFFCDCISGSQGKFYMLDQDDIPWRLDINIEENLKLAIQQKIKPIKVTAENENSFSLQGYMLYQDHIYGCNMEVDKKYGIVSMSDDNPLHVYKLNDIFTCTLDSEEDKEKRNENFIKLDSIPCCIDPLYEMTEVTK